MPAALPGVKVGPLDPDVTAEFGQVSAKNSARQLIRLHHQAHPPQLRRALSRPLDHERTKGLVLDEVRGYVAGLKLDNGDRVVPKDAIVRGAQVRGDRDREQVLTFTYETKSGRTAKWFAPYDTDELPGSAEQGDELVRIAEMKDKGFAAFDSEGASTSILRRENAGLRRQVEALRAHAEGKDVAGDANDEETEVPASSAARPDVQIVADNEELRRQNEELKARVAQLEPLAERAGQEQLTPRDGESGEDGGSVAEDPPFEGYDEVNAKDLVSRIRDEDTSREEVEAIVAYERTHNNRRSVVGAGEARLDRS